MGRYSAVLLILCSLAGIIDNNFTHVIFPMQFMGQAVLQSFSNQLFGMLIVLALGIGFVGPFFLRRQVNDPIKIEIEANKITSDAEIIDTSTLPIFSRGNDLIADADALSAHLNFVLNHLQRGGFLTLRPAIEIIARRPDGCGLTHLETLTMEQAALDAGAMSVKIIPKISEPQPLRDRKVQEHRVMELGIWFEDLTGDPERLFCLVEPQTAGMPETWFDELLGRAEASERRYVSPGVLTAVKVRICSENYEQFVTTLRKISQRLGTNPWVRDLAEPDYALFWESGRPFFESASR
ncbi:hypothetical protein [Pseudomonas brenneri]|uniref:hypothetical protein n=1 Tax=Pseudomonas brenneri TaxID=129817 RepID=UPI003B9F90FE